MTTVIFYSSYSCLLCFSFLLSHLETFYSSTKVLHLSLSLPPKILVYFLSLVYLPTARPCKWFPWRVPSVGLQVVSMCITARDKRLWNMSHAWKGFYFVLFLYIDHLWAT